MSVYDSSWFYLILIDFILILFDSAGVRKDNIVQARTKDRQTGKNKVKVEIERNGKKKREKERERESNEDRDKEPIRRPWEYKIPIIG